MSGKKETRRVGPIVSACPQNRPDLGVKLGLAGRGDLRAAPAWPAAP